MISLHRPAWVAGPGAGQARRHVVELVGVAATGKTSLLRALRGQEPGWRGGLRPPKYQHAWSAVSLLPTFLALHRPARHLLWKEMKRITYLRTLRRALAAEARRPDGAVVLDEGPVYMMARIRMYGGPAVRSAAFAPWWREVGREWQRVLDLVVWLDAPDAILARRLRSRAQRHRLQGTKEQDIEEFLASYRAAYAEVMSLLGEQGGVRVLEFRTDREMPERIAERVVMELQETACR
jgi:thymidylate kinase